MVEGHFLQMGGLIFRYNGKHGYISPFGPPETSWNSLGSLYFAHSSPQSSSFEFPSTQDSIPNVGIHQAGYDELQRVHNYVTKGEIEDRSKSDGLAKLVVLIQTAWFTGQCVARAVQKLAITELEIITLAYTALNGVMHFFWWDKPLDVRFPAVIELGISEDDEVHPVGEALSPFPSHDETSAAQDENPKEKPTAFRKIQKAWTPGQFTNQLSLLKERGSFYSYL